MMTRFPFVCGAAVLATTAWASTTYTYTGVNYNSVTNFSSCTSGPCANYTAAMSVTGSFTTASPLAANLFLQDITAQVISYSFSDGINTYASSEPNSRIFEFVIDTDGSAQIDGSGIILQQWQSVSHTPPSRFAYVHIASAFVISNNNSSCTANGTSLSGLVADTCTNYGSDSGTSSASAPTGSWTSGSSAPVPTLGEWGTICLTALLIVFAWLRLRRRQGMAGTA